MTESSGNGFDYDWLIIRSQLRRQRSRCAAPCRERLQRRNPRKRAPFPRRGLRQVYWNLVTLLAGGTRDRQGVHFRLHFQGRLHCPAGCPRGRKIVDAEHAPPSSRQPGFLHQSPAGELGTGPPQLAPHYDTAQRMLGEQTLLRQSHGQPAPRGRQASPGVDRNFPAHSGRGVLRQARHDRADPALLTCQAPRRALDAMFCGAGMVGCREGAKNTLVKNYLWFADRAFCRPIPSASGGSPA